MGAHPTLAAAAIGSYALAGHNGMTYNQSGAIKLLLSHLNGSGHCQRVSAVNFNHIPAPGAIFAGSVFAGDLVDLRGELHIIAVIEHDEVLRPRYPAIRPAPWDISS